MKQRENCEQVAIIYSNINLVSFNNDESFAAHGSIYIALIESLGIKIQIM